MTDTKLLVGSLSNDLLRVANSVQRGSNATASRFLQEAGRWAIPLQTRPVAEYIRNIAQAVSSAPLNHISNPEWDIIHPWKLYHLPATNNQTIPNKLRLNLRRLKPNLNYP